MATKREVSKFTNRDRKQVIDFLAKELKTTLFPIAKGCWTIYKDNKNQCHLILGGSSGWAGISKDDFPLLERDGLFTFAVNNKSTYSLYQGELDTLLTQQEYLRVTPNKYHFLYKTAGNHLIIKDYPDYRLTKIAEVAKLSPNPLPPNRKL